MFYSLSSYCILCVEISVFISLCMYVCMYVCMYIYMPMELFVSCAADLATIGGPLVVVTPALLPPGPFSFVYVVLGNSKLFLSWRFPCAVAECSS